MTGHDPTGHGPTGHAAKGPAAPPAVVGPPTATALRGLGVALLGLGPLVACWALVRGLDLVDGVARAVVALVIALLAVPLLVTLGGSLVRLLGRGPRLELDADGFAVRGISRRRVGEVAGAPWAEVRQVTRTGDLVRVVLRDNRGCAFDARVLGRPVELVAAAMQRRLDASRGYRPLR